MTNQPWQDKDRLERLYLEEHLSSREIGERLGCSKTTVLKWLDRHGIEKQPYDDEELLRRLYWEEGKSTQEIAERFGITDTGVRVVMDRHGIERRTNSEALSLYGLQRHPYFGTGVNGYEWIQTKLNGYKWQVLHHRLLAVAEYGLDEVENQVVHHQNEIPWDNRPENIELMSRAEHTSHHHKGVPK